MQNHDRTGPARNTITACRGVGLVDTAYPTGQTFPVGQHIRHCQVFVSRVP